MTNVARRSIQPSLFSTVSATDEVWWALEAAAPQMVTTMRRYLAQTATFLAPSSVDVVDNSLRQLAAFLTGLEPPVVSMAGVTRTHIEDFKVALAARPGLKGTLSANTQRQRLRMLRIFFERLIEWGWDDAPVRNPILGGDIPPRPEPLPRFLDDPTAAKLMSAAVQSPFVDRLVVSMLARTGMRVGEFCGLAADAVVIMGDAPLVTGPGRQAAQRPLHSPARRAGRAPRALDGRQRRTHPPLPPAHGR